MRKGGRKGGRRGGIRREDEEGMVGDKFVACKI